MPTASVTPRRWSRVIFWRSDSPSTSSNQTYVKISRAHSGGSWPGSDPLASTSSFLSTVVDCADDLFAPETEVRPFDVEW